MFIVEGFHVPVILLFDVAGSGGGVVFWHKGPICVNVGVVPELIVSFRVKVSGQPPAVVMLL